MHTATPHYIQFQLIGYKKDQSIIAKRVSVLLQNPSNPTVLRLMEKKTAMKTFSLKFISKAVEGRRDKKENIAPGLIGGTMGH